MPLGRIGFEDRFAVSDDSHIHHPHIHTSTSTRGGRAEERTQGGALVDSTLLLDIYPTRPAQSRAFSQRQKKKHTPRVPRERLSLPVEDGAGGGWSDVRHVN